MTPIEGADRIVAPVAVHEPPAEYTPEAHAARVQGVVIARLMIKEHGRVDHVEVIQRLPMGLTPARALAEQPPAFIRAGGDGLSSDRRCRRRRQ